MIPECIVQNIAQPHRNPAAGENISRRKTYTPPVRGYADVSSAQMLAPNQVSAPATIQTRSMPPKCGTARLTSDGWTKIDAPTIVPTTIAVAWTSPIERASFDMRPLSYWRWGSRRLRVDCLNCFEGIRVRRRLVVTVPFDAREAERQAAWILRARLDVVEGN